MNQHSTPIDSILVQDIVGIARAKKAENIVVLDVRNQSAIGDWFLICEGGNTTHTRAIAEEIIVSLKKKRVLPWHHEGLESGRWIVIDYSDVIIHVMIPELRRYYALDDLWHDARKTILPDDTAHG